MIDLRNRTALVTGGSRGIGRATALLLARAGADVGITYLTRAEDAEKVAAQIRGLGRKSFAMGGDLGDPEKVEKIFQAVKREFGRLDLFVGNAGIWPEEEVPLQQMAYLAFEQTSQEVIKCVYIQNAEGQRYYLRLEGYDTATNQASFLVLDGLPNGAYELHLSGSKGLTDFADLFSARFIFELKQHHTSQQFSSFRVHEIPRFASFIV